MHDSVSPQLPHGMKKVNHDTINVKLKSVIIVRSDQEESLQGSVQVASSTSNFGTSNNNASNEIQEEIDLMNFDDDCLNFDFNNNNNHVNDIINEKANDIPMIDQLLCDLNFGRDHLMAKGVMKDKKMNNNIQNGKTIPKALKQETPNTIKDNGDKMKRENEPTDVFTFQVPPISSPANVIKGSDPSYVKPTNGMQPTIMTEMVNASRVKPANGLQPTIVPRTLITKGTNKIFPAMEEAGQNSITKKKIYSFVELLIYQFSPITKELYNDIHERFSHYAVDYDLLNDGPQTISNQPRYPGVLRNTIQQYNGYTRNRSMDYKNDEFTTSVRKHFESPLELSFLKECMIAQNRWIALLYEKRMRIKEAKDCKNMKWVNAHMALTSKHTESCFAYHVTKDQKNNAKYAKYCEKNLNLEEKDEF